MKMLTSYNGTTFSEGFVNELTTEAVISVHGHPSMSFQVFTSYAAFCGFALTNSERQEHSQKEMLRNQVTTSSSAIFVSPSVVHLRNFF